MLNNVSCLHLFSSLQIIAAFLKNSCGNVFDLSGIVCFMLSVVTVTGMLCITAYGR